MKKISPVVKKILAVTASVSMGASLTACAVQTDAASTSETAAASESEEDILTKTSRELLQTTTKSDENGKDETVYVIGDADGNTDQVIDSVWLKNGDGKDELSDKTNLTDIENTKGDEEYTENADGTITWDAHGNDIYYRGNSDASNLPIEVNVSYKLDGKEVSAADLEGASGHLEVTFSYENHLSKTVDINGEKTEINKPCAVVSGLLLENEDASDIQVTNGKVVNDGDRSVVVGLALPGMLDNLDLSDLEEEQQDKVDELIPEEVIVEAEVTDFSLLGTISLASYDLDLDIDLDKYDDEIDDLKDSADELQDGADELQDGADELSDYMQQLTDGAKELADGTGSLSDGASQLSSGTDELKSGTESLVSGTDSLSSGTSQLATGLSTLASSAAALPDGTSQLLAGAQKLEAALKSGDSSSVDKYGVYEAVTAIGSGAKQLESVLQQIMSGAEAINTGAQSIAAGAKSGSTEQPGISEAADLLSSALTTAATNLQTQVGTAVSGLSGANTYGQAALDSLNALAADETLTEEQKAQVSSAIANLQAEMQTVSAVSAALQSAGIDLTQATTAITGIKNGAEAIYAGAQSIAAGAKSGSTDQASYGIYEAAAAAYAGAQQLAASADTLASKIAYMANDENMGALVSGLEQLSGQSGTLISAVDQLSNGAGQVNSGTKTLSDGAKTLNDGVGTLSSGAKELADGALQADDGAKTLADGADELLDGAKTLADGVHTLNEDGIEKITELLGDKADTIYERLKAVIEYAEEDAAFSGSMSGIDTSVQYIFKTGEIESSEE